MTKTTARSILSVICVCAVGIYINSIIFCANHNWCDNWSTLLVSTHLLVMVAGSSIGIMIIGNALLYIIVKAVGDY